MLKWTKFRLLNMNIWQRIKEAREMAGMKPSALAREVGVSPSAVTQWETGQTKKLDGDNLLKVSKALHVRPEWLQYGELPMRNDGDFAPVDANVAPGPDVTGLVPLISWVQAGNWGEVIDNFSPGDAEEWLPCFKKMGPYAFALRVRGGSMERKYQDGDIIFVDPDVGASSGRNVVVRMEDENTATFKHLVIDEAGNKFLKPLNPDWPGPKVIQINGNARICGVVVGKWVPE